MEYSAIVIFILKNFGFKIVAMDQEEITAMEAIYGSDFSVGESSCQIRTNGICISFFFVDSERTTSVSCSWLSRDECALLCTDLPSSLFAASSEILARLPDKPAAKEEEKFEDDEECLDFVESEPIKDRKSKFVAFAAKTSSKEEAMRFVRCIRRKVDGCTHAIAAFEASGEMWRDDDGEGGAGDALLHLIDVLKKKNVVVVVARWFGGIKLGGDRFRRICDAAKDALMKL